MASRAVRSLVGVARSVDVALGPVPSRGHGHRRRRVYRAPARCDRILLTVVERDYPEADVRLERPDALTAGLVCLAREYHAPDEHNPVAVTFSEWVRP